MTRAHSVSAEWTTRVALCRDKAIEICGRVLRPDQTTAYVEFYLSHAFPVVTVDGTALHPQVVANSFHSMENKVFDLCHLMKKYGTGPQDRILGTVIAVEFPDTPAGGWTVQSDRASAPGIRAVACMHRNAEQVDEILQKHFTGQIRWTVSMEQLWEMDNSGFLLKAGSGRQNEEFSGWDRDTPEDFKTLGWTYVPAVDAPLELLKCLDPKDAKIIRKFRGAETLMLFGGLNGSVHYNGVGLTPLGKEDEAEVMQMLASRKMIVVNGLILPDVFDLLRRTAVLPEC